jgi:Tfp pilus assembly protein PilX
MSQSIDLRARRRREGGAALLVSMLLLVAMTLIGLASLDTVMRDRETAGYSSLAQTALYGADAGLAASLEVLRTEIVGNALAPGDCLATPVPNATLPNGTAYGPDTTAANPQICMLAAAEPCEELGSSIEVGQPIYLYTVWNVRTEGTAPAGATARIQATAERCHAFNN